MTPIIAVLLGLAAIVLLFSLFKRLIKLALTLALFVLVLLGLWYFLEDSPSLTVWNPPMPTQAPTWAVSPGVLT